MTGPLVLGCDIDGTITDASLGRLGSSHLGALLWKVAREADLAKRLIREAHCNPLARTVLQQAYKEGWVVDLITAREPEYAVVTDEWLDANGVPNRSIFYRPDDVPVVEHKARWVRQCDLYLDDDEDLLKQLSHRLGAAAPPMLAVVSWELVPGILHLVERIGG
jgi:uncharacterized HAD superfamily protein